MDLRDLSFEFTKAALSGLSVDTNGCTADTVAIAAVDIGVMTARIFMETFEDDSEEVHGETPIDQE